MKKTLSVTHSPRRPQIPVVIKFGVLMSLQTFSNCVKFGVSRHKDIRFLRVPMGIAGRPNNCAGTTMLHVVTCKRVCAKHSVVDDFAFQSDTAFFRPPEIFSALIQMREILKN
jgi:hypothetical protein